MRKALFPLAGLLVLGSTALSVLYYLLLLRPGPPLRDPVRIDVATGEPFGVTARALEAHGLVPSARALALWARLAGRDRDIRSGAYLFEEALAPVDLVEKMRSGEIMLLRVTLAEGMTARAIAESLERLALGTVAESLSLVDDPAFARSLGIESDSLEGYLFPDTYFFAPSDRPRKVLATLVGRFREVVTGELRDRAAARGLSLHEVVTLASVVEKETGRAEERPVVAAVFLNRLKRRMPLQADPTVIYGVHDFDGNLTRRHLETPGPYNTYLNVGLPPGPIANPGLGSILAVLYPADVPYVYFVARGDGSHEFTADLNDHTRAVNRYQRRRESQPSDDARPARSGG